MAFDKEVEERLQSIGLPFNRYGLDPYGISREHLAWFYSTIKPLYRHYFKVQVEGMENVPKAGRALLIGNHSGGIPLDAAMVVASLFFDHDPPRHAHGMVEYFAQKWPFISPLFSRLGHVTGLPEHADRFLRDERIVLAFPEGARGTGKLFRDRYRLVRFGTGFARLAMRTKSPVVPFAFVGGEEAVPTVMHAKRLAKLLGAPYLPITPYLLPIPLPVPCKVVFGQPIYLEGDGNEPDDVIALQVAAVREQIEELMRVGLTGRDMPFPFSNEMPNHLR